MNFDDSVKLYEPETAKISKSKLEEMNRKERRQWEREAKEIKRRRIIDKQHKQLNRRKKSKAARKARRANR